MTPELKAKLLRYANECEPFTAHNHIEITDIGEGSSRVELHLTCESMNRWGQPHGGILFTLADDACGIAMSGLRQETCVTVSSTVDFMAPAGDARHLIARGEVTRAGRRTCFCRAEITTAPATACGPTQASPCPWISGCPCPPVTAPLLVKLPGEHTKNRPA